MVISVVHKCFIIAYATGITRSSPEILLFKPKASIFPFAWRKGGGE